jgi:hypothetical protein
MFLGLKIMRICGSYVVCWRPGATNDNALVLVLVEDWEEVQMEEVPTTMHWFCVSWFGDCHVF